jgi:hypothetical protein
MHRIRDEIFVEVEIKGIFISFKSYMNIYIASDFRLRFAWLPLPIVAHEPADSLKEVFPLGQG